MNFFTHFLNFNNGTTLHLDLVDYRIKEFLTRFSESQFKFTQKNSKMLFHRIGLVDIEKDIKQYGTNLTCMGCKLAMHTMAICYCLDNNISIIADGYTAYQHEWIEQMPEAIEKVRNFENRYNIKYINPAWKCRDKNEAKQRLIVRGFSPKALEGDCIWGNCFSIPSPDKVVQYISDKLPICEEYIKDHIANNSNFRELIDPEGEENG